MALRKRQQVHSAVHKVRDRHRAPLICDHNQAPLIQVHRSGLLDLLRLKPTKWPRGARREPTRSRWRAGGGTPFWVHPSARVPRSGRRHLCPRSLAAMCRKKSRRSGRRSPAAACGRKSRRRHRCPRSPAAACGRRSRRRHRCPRSTAASCRRKSRRSRPPLVLQPLEGRCA